MGVFTSILPKVYAGFTPLFIACLMINYIDTRFNNAEYFIILIHYFFYNVIVCITIWYLCLILYIGTLPYISISTE